MSNGSIASACCCATPTEGCCAFWDCSTAATKDITLSGSSTTTSTFPGNSATFVTQEIDWTISATVTRQGTECELGPGDSPSDRLRYAATSCEFTWTRKFRLWSVGQHPGLNIQSGILLCRIFRPYDGDDSCPPAEFPEGSQCYTCGYDICDCPSCAGIYGASFTYPSSCYCDADPPNPPTLHSRGCHKLYDGNSNFQCFLWNYNLSDEPICDSFSPKPFASWVFKHVGTWTETFTGTLNGLADSPEPYFVQDDDVVTIICDNDCKSQDRPILYFTPDTTGKKASWEWDSADHPCCPMPCGLEPSTCLETGTYSFDFEIWPFLIIGNSQCLDGTTFDNPITGEDSYPYASWGHGRPNGNSGIVYAYNPGYGSPGPSSPRLDMCGVYWDFYTDYDCSPLNRSLEYTLCLYNGDPFGLGCKGYSSALPNLMSNACVQDMNEACCGYEKGGDTSVCNYPDQFLEVAETEIVWSWTCT